MCEDSSLAFLDEAIAAVELLLDRDTPEDRIYRHIFATLGRCVLGTAIRKWDVQELQRLFAEVAAG